MGSFADAPKPPVYSKRVVWLKVLAKGHKAGQIKARGF